ncbi:hypothetical protein, partial [Rubellimicrobium rubrum]|uniref:hypothetical protein n=1 Tax=Rubellimicrobium rubrum TaxID=2585369 RepID=UPI001C3F3785
DEELQQTLSILGLAEGWRRGEFFIGLRQSSGLRAYDFQAGDHWEAMFLPNGEGTLEWRLGFEVKCEKGYSVLVQDAAQAGFRTLQGVLTEPILSRMSSTAGFSIALKPEGEVQIRRGDPIAWIYAIDGETLRANL